MNLNLWLQLTEDEKRALEQKHDFGLTDQHVKDVIAARGRVGQPTVASLTACIKDEQAYLPWVRAQRAKAHTDAGRAAWDQQIAVIQSRIDELDRKLAALTMWEAELGAVTVGERLQAAE